MSEYLHIDSHVNSTLPKKDKIYENWDINIQGQICIINKFNKNIISYTSLFFI